MKDIIQNEKEAYPMIVRKAKGEIDGVSYVITLEYDESFIYKWWIRLYKEESFVSKWKCSLRQVLFSWKCLANRHFSKLLARHNFKEEQMEVNKNGTDM